MSDALVAWEQELDRVYGLARDWCKVAGTNPPQTLRVLAITSNDPFLMEKACALEEKINWSDINDSALDAYRCIMN